MRCCAAIEKTAMQSSRHHHELTDGVGKCSVPMWAGGCPAGFCDEPAYGEPEPSETYRLGGYGEIRREDGRYAGYVPGLACWNHAGPVGPSGVRVFEDGGKWCAVDEGFVNLMESPAGFGDSRSEAVSELLEARETDQDGTTEDVVAEKPAKCHACGADMHDGESLCVKCDVKKRADRQLNEDVVRAIEGGQAPPVWGGAEAIRLGVAMKGEEEAGKEVAECEACELHKAGLEEVMEGALDPDIVDDGATAMWLMDVVAAHVGSGVKVPTPEEFELRRAERRRTHPDEHVDDDG